MYIRIVLTIFYILIISSCSSSPKELDEKISFDSKNNIDLSKFDIELVKTETLQRGTFAKSIDNMIFVKKKKIVGPVVLEKDISVLKVLGINKQGSIKGLNDVYDEIYQRVFKIKSLEVQDLLLDSLKKTVNISINPKYQ